MGTWNQERVIEGNLAQKVENWEAEEQAEHLEEERRCRRNV
jgi:hypothetical protein